MIKRIWNPLKKILTEKFRKKIKYKSVKRAEDILKEIDEKINNELIKLQELQKKEDRRKAEIQVLREIIQESPNYYSEEELKIILNELTNKKSS